MLMRIQIARKGCLQHSRIPHEKCLVRSLLLSLLVVFVYSCLSAEQVQVSELPGTVIGRYEWLEPRRTIDSCLRDGGARGQSTIFRRLARESVNQSTFALARSFLYERLLHRS